MQQFTAKARYLNCSPYKLRPLVDVIRGKSASFALAWFSVNKNKRIIPLLKLVQSAVANAQYLQSGILAEALVVKEIQVDQGPIKRYFKPGAQGRAMPQRLRQSHASVVLEVKQKEA